MERKRQLRHRRACAVVRQTPTARKTNRCCWRIGLSGQPGKARGSRFRQRPARQPGGDPVNVHGHCRHDLLQMGLRQPPVACAAHPEGPDALRQGSLDPGALRIEQPAFLGFQTLPGRIQGFKLCHWLEVQPARRLLGTGAKRPWPGNPGKPPSGNRPDGPAFPPHRHIHPASLAKKQTRTIRATRGLYGNKATSKNDFPSLDFASLSIKRAIFNRLTTREPLG